MSVLSIKSKVISAVTKNNKQQATVYPPFLEVVRLRWLLGCDFRRRIPIAELFQPTELIQWVWRLRVRRGEPITLYLPSPRMRRLFEEWLVS